jgi:hypothetical protein
MNVNTPLTEVAHILPAETASLLLHLPTDRACAVLAEIRNIVTTWEENGVTMDPITFGVVIHSVTYLVRENEQLRRRP